MNRIIKEILIKLTFVIGIRDWVFLFFLVFYRVRNISGFYGFISYEILYGAFSFFVNFYDFEMLKFINSFFF